MQSFYASRSQKRKKSSHQSLLALLGSMRKKAANKMMMRLTPEVKFANILQAAFAPISFQQNFLNPNCKKKKTE
jgi:hypothetical protein